MRKFRILISSVFMSTFLLVGIGLPAQAGMVGTQDLLTEFSSSGNVQVQRDQIQQQLVELGVEPAQAEQRVVAMSDAQVMEINLQLADLPAGASAEGIILTVFIVFVITDVIGATDIFPFIKPVR